VPTPSPEAQRLVEPVRAALAGLPADKRALWAATWAKAALVVEAEGATSVAVLTDTASLRVLTTTALDIAWRRIGGNAPGSVAGLREAVEAAMRSALGLDSVPVTPDVRARYAEVARAIASCRCDRAKHRAANRFIAPGVAAAPKPGVAAPWPNWKPMAGAGMFGNWKTPCTGRSCWPKGTKSKTTPS
jgi:hypothetical protein